MHHSGELPPGRRAGQRPVRAGGLDRQHPAGRRRALLGEAERVGDQNSIRYYQLNRFIRSVYMYIPLILLPLSSRHETSETGRRKTASNLVRRQLQVRTAADRRG